MAFIKFAVIAVLLAVGFVLIRQHFAPELDIHVGGYVKPGFEEVEESFRKLLKTHMTGAAFAAYYEGKPVVDLWGGYADAEAEQHWEKDTISIAFSTTKGMATLCVAVLVSRGYIKYDEPISKIWPEFAANGKGEITLRTYMNHEAGLAGLDESLTREDVANNTARYSQVLADQKPLWEPGTIHGYHAMTFGLYIDQIVRRVDPKKRDVAQFFEEEIAKPLGLDFSISLKPSDRYRDTRLIESPMLLDMIRGTLETWDFSLVPTIYKMLTDPDSLLAKAMTSIKLPKNWNNIHKKTVQISSYSGHGTARAVAEVFGLVVMNGAMVNGKPLISEKVRSEFMRVPDVIRPDRIYNIPVFFSAGMALLKSPAGDWMYGAPGYGGQMGFGDPKKKIGLGLLTNHLRTYRITHDPRIKTLFNAVYASVKKIEEARK